MLVLEAGRPDYIWDPFIHMPAALTIPIGNRFYDWKYESEPEPHMNGRRIYHARGKVLGGSSSINGMIFQRGNPLDYERWAADEGMADWDFAHCLPYFKRMENCLAADPDDPFRGHTGPLAEAHVYTAAGYVVRYEAPWSDFPTEDAVADSARMNRWIESEIRKNPAQYLWVHRRFKTRPPGEPPLY